MFVKTSPKIHIFFWRPLFQIIAEKMLDFQHFQIIYSCNDFKKFQIMRRLGRTNRCRLQVRASRPASTAAARSVSAAGTVTTYVSRSIRPLGPKLRMSSLQPQPPPGARPRSARPARPGFRRPSGRPSPPSSPPGPACRRPLPVFQTAPSVIPPVIRRGRQPSSSRISFCSSVPAAAASWSMVRMRARPRP